MPACHPERRARDLGEAFDSSEELPDLSFAISGLQARYTWKLNIFAVLSIKVTLTESGWVELVPLNPKDHPFPGWSIHQVRRPSLPLDFIL
jgi:hypothetical protein